MIPSALEEQIKSVKSEVRNFIRKKCKVNTFARKSDQMLVFECRVEFPS